MVQPNPEGYHRAGFFQCLGASSYCGSGGAANEVPLSEGQLGGTGGSFVLLTMGVAVCTWDVG